MLKQCRQEIYVNFLNTIINVFIINLMNEFKGKLGILVWSIVGECLKFIYKLGILTLNNVSLNRNYERKEHIVISLTSYGRRVNNVLPVVIYSLLCQTLKPDVIVLWLDKSWNNDNLPFSLKKLMKHGLTVKFCDDIRSYKKLIPSLEEYPESIIITVDDDVYYRKNLVERLIECHNQNPGKVICNDAHFPTFSDDGTLNSYNYWNHDIDNKDNILVFPVGVGACLYKREYLHDDVLDKSKFMMLSPDADDIWFYFMAYIKGTGHIVLPYIGNVLIPVDNVYQLLHRKSNLSNQNYRESKNDIQLKAVMDYYNINLS